MIPLGKTIARFSRARAFQSDYPYYDTSTRGVRFEAMSAFLKTLAPRSIIVLHACCHNPTGADLTSEQWQTLLEVLRERELLPFLDIAYQGFARALRKMALYAAVRAIRRAGADRKLILEELFALR